MKTPKITNYFDDKEKSIVEAIEHDTNEPEKDPINPAQMQAFRKAAQHTLDDE